MADAKGIPVRVAVRVRPALPRDAGDPLDAVSVSARPLLVSVQQPGLPVQKFLVDHVFKPATVPVGAGADQAHVYGGLCSGMLDAALEDGIGGTVLACGGPGSGKSHSILGYGEEPGVIPHATAELLRRVSKGDPPDLSTWCSYFEVHQESLRDLLCPEPSGGDSTDRLSREGASGCSQAASSMRESGSAPLLPFQSPSSGSVCVPRLTECPVQRIEDIQRLIEYGMRRRAVAARQLRGGVGRRAHTVFSLRVEMPAVPSCSSAATPGKPKAVQDAASSSGGAAREAVRRSRLTFVDIAGPPRLSRCETALLSAQSTRNAGKKASPFLDLKHSIAQLFESQEGGSAKSRSWHPLSSRRRPLLVRLLADALSGATRLAVLATVSPARADVSDTLAALQLAKTLGQSPPCTTPSGTASVAEEQSRRLPEELRELRQQLEVAMAAAVKPQVALPKSLFFAVAAEIAALREDEGAMQRLHARQQSAGDAAAAAVALEERREVEAARLQRAHAASLRGLGLASQAHRRGIGRHPCLVNVSDDPMLSGCLAYVVPLDAHTTIGSSSFSSIVLKGLGMAATHCRITGVGCSTATAGDGVPSEWCLQIVNEDPVNNRILVNGVPVVQLPRALRDGDRLLLGWAHVLRVVAPSSAASWGSLTPASTGEASSAVPEDLAGCVAEASSDKACGHALAAVLPQLAELAKTHSWIGDSDSPNEALRSLCALVDEANALTNEMRPNSDLRFEVCAFGVGAKQLRPGVDNDVSSVFAVRLSGPRDLGATPPGGSRRVIALFTVGQFQDRLRLLQSLYDREDRRRGTAMREDLLLDAWAEPMFSEVWRRACNARLLLQAVAQTAKPAAASAGAVAKGALNRSPHVLMPDEHVHIVCEMLDARVQGSDGGASANSSGPKSAAAAAPSVPEAAPKPEAESARSIRGPRAPSPARGASPPSRTSRGRAKSPSRPVSPGRAAGGGGGCGSAKTPGRTGSSPTPRYSLTEWRNFGRAGTGSRATGVRAGPKASVGRPSPARGTSGHASSSNSAGQCSSAGRCGSGGGAGAGNALLSRQSTSVAAGGGSDSQPQRPSSPPQQARSQPQSPSGAQLREQLEAPPPSPDPDALRHLPGADSAPDEPNNVPGAFGSRGGGMSQFFSLRSALPAPAAGSMSGGGGPGRRPASSRCGGGQQHKQQRTGSNVGGGRSSSANAGSAMPSSGGSANSGVGGSSEGLSGNGGGGIKAGLAAGTVASGSSAKSCPAARPSSLSGVTPVAEQPCALSCQSAPAPPTTLAANHASASSIGGTPKSSGCGQVPPLHPWAAVDEVAGPALEAGNKRDATALEARLQAVKEKTTIARLLAENARLRAARSFLEEQVRQQAEIAKAPQPAPAASADTAAQPASAAYGVARAEPLAMDASRPPVAPVVPRPISPASAVAPKSKQARELQGTHGEPRR